MVLCRVSRAIAKPTILACKTLEPLQKNNNLRIHHECKLLIYSCTAGVLQVPRFIKKYLFLANLEKKLTNIGYQNNDLFLLCQFQLFQLICNLNN